ncbi:putative PTH11-typeG-protein-coupled receptor [Trichoderma citrinoviride]|uniref:Putative PTH11-typeG-protein-coupled receptor n=1 Tax=Trichoderma citrinoviride TaxID=58853 RepID=A0A2T4B6L5_9HYPO|nr:putative PTH11-typeG-protein-coupled receptor [Trichoderma citrinoviride]PTB64965.1 putative PTH11-typeG-protein-coupled receptor [Trichoderma citrinoviride]
MTATAASVPNGPDTKNGYAFLYVNIPLLAVAICIVGFRVWWRCIKNSGGTLNKADVCVVICLIFNIIQVSCISVAIVRWGFGHHAPFLTAEERYYSLLYFFIFQCFVKNTVAITKLSFLFLYLDIFPQRKFRIICWTIIIQIAAGLVALSFTTIFQCSPVKYSWDKTIPGTCINIKAFWYGQSGWNTLMDVLVLVLPIPVILKLQMNRRAKISILAVFVLGAFVTITSIERLISLNFNATFILDFTWATGTSVIWTQVESTVGVICACTPSLRMPLARFIPFLFGTSKHDPSYELSDGVHGACPRSNNWNSQSTRSKRRDDFEVAIDDLETSYKSEGSQEQIMGIKKTVSIDMTFQERARESDAGSSKLYAI